MLKHNAEFQLVEQVYNYKPLPVYTYKCIMWDVTTVILSKPLPAMRQISGRKVSLRSWPTESRVSEVSLARVPNCPGDLVQGSSFQVCNSSLFITFGVTECQTSVPRITVAALCFPERSGPYHDFFVLYPARFLSYTHQVFFLCPAPVKISAFHLSRILCRASVPHQGFSRAYQGCLRAPDKEMSFVCLFTSLCGSSRYYTLR